MTLEQIALLFGFAGALIGLGADAVAHRWPEHDEAQARRPVDWRTAVVMAAGAVVFYGLAARFGNDAIAFIVYFALFVALTLLLATDLDQRLLPDVVTLPLIPVAAAVLLLGWSPTLAGKEFGLISGIAAGVLFPVVLFITDRLFGGGLGEGDLKLSVSLGLLFGLSAYFYGLLVASIGFAVVLVVLIVARRLSLKTFIPFGPVLIF